MLLNEVGVLFIDCHEAISEQLHVSGCLSFPIAEEEL